MKNTYDLIIVGGGNLGQALANYVDFEKQGFYIVLMTIMEIFMLFILVVYFMAVLLQQERIAKVEFILQD